MIRAELRGPGTRVVVARGATIHQAVRSALRLIGLRTNPIGARTLIRDEGGVQTYRQIVGADSVTLEYELVVSRSRSGSSTPNFPNSRRHTKQVVLRLPREAADRLAQMAAQAGTTKSALVTAWIARDEKST